MHEAVNISDIKRCHAVKYGSVNLRAVTGNTRENIQTSITVLILCKRYGCLFVNSNTFCP